MRTDKCSESEATPRFGALKVASVHIKHLWVCNVLRRVCQRLDRVFRTYAVSNTNPVPDSSRGLTFEGRINRSRIQRRHVDLSRNAVRTDLDKTLAFFLQVEVHTTASILDKGRPELGRDVYLSAEKADRAWTRCATGNNTVAVGSWFGTKQSTTRQRSWESENEMEDKRYFDSTYCARSRRSHSDLTHISPASSLSYLRELGSWGAGDSAQPTPMIQSRYRSFSRGNSSHCGLTAGFHPWQTRKWTC